MSKPAPLSIAAMPSRRSRDWGACHVPIGGIADHQRDALLGKGRLTSAGAGPRRGRIDRISCVRRDWSWRHRTSHFMAPAKCQGGRCEADHPRADRVSSWISTPDPPTVRRLAPCFPSKFRLCDVPHILRQIVGNLMPGRPGTGENMRFRTDRGRVDQRAHGDMDEGALPNHRPEQRAAMLAVHVMRGLCGRPAVDQQIVISPDKLQAVAGNAGERFECRTSGAPAFEQWQLSAYSNASATS